MMSKFRRLRKWLLLLYILFTGFLILSIAHQNKINRSYPYFIAPNWHCGEPSFTLSYSTEGHRLISSDEILEWNGVVMPVDVEFLMTAYCVYPDTSASYQDYDDRLFSGTWKYRNGNFILIIEEDFIFDHQFSELVFSPAVSS